MKKTRELIVWRDSVAAGDDCDAPHELVIAVGSDSLGSFVNRLLGAHYLPGISGGRATWILESGRDIGRPLAVIAQQWAQPRFLVPPDAHVLTYIEPRAKPHLHLIYWCQVDPDKVFQCFQRDEPLPDRYGR
jgi:hypothetical protein